MIETLSKTIVKTQKVRLYTEAEPFHFERGDELGPVDVAFETYGELNSSGTNCILICHALTGNAHVAFYNSDEDKVPGWWDSIIGPGKSIDSSKYFVVCSNVIGGCYGTTGSSTLDPKTLKEYGNAFPPGTIRDMVRVQKRLLDWLGVKKVQLVIGGSMGGMQAIEWAVSFPEMVERVAPIATGASHTAWGIALNEVARQAIFNDPAYRNGNYYAFGQPSRGLALARMIAMISYRSPESFTLRFQRERLSEDNGANFFDVKNIYQVESYLHYQGVKLVERFDANTYIYISRAMDMHDVARDRGELRDVLRGIKCRTLCIGITSDVLYPAEEQRGLAAMIPGARYAEIRSIHGHDAFLIEFDQLNRIITDFLESNLKI
ncbi:MAG TPA: homoserine O-acetyltransferase [Candidatus Kryptonia bacterium]